MNNFGKIRTSSHQLRRFIWGLAVVWTIIVATSLVWHIVQTKRESLDLARIQAREAYEKDVVYRRWNAGHGGVYVPVTKEAQPNPHLSDIPERDITTASGKTLTLMNPAYMTRQAHELERQRLGVRGHITSLNPIRPENAPDSWETKALRAFERGEAEISSVEDLEGKKYMRLMRPLIAEKGCLKCHAKQGYHEGDIRGGISVSIPMEPFLAIERKHIITFAPVYGLFWMVGLCGLGLGGQRLMRAERERRQAEEALQKAHDELEKKVEERTADLSKANILLKREISERKHAEEALRDSEEKFRTITASAKDAIIMIDNDGNISYWNEAAERILGYASEDALGIEAHKMLAPERYQEAYKKGYEIFRTSGQGPVIGKTLELWAVRKDGTEIPIELSISAVMLNQKWNAIGIMRDITERKKAEEALRSSEARLNLQIRRMPIGCIVWDHDFRVLSWNPSAEKIFGFTAEEMMGKQPYGFIVPKEVQSHVDSIWQRLLEGDSTAHSVNNNMTKDGRTIIGEWSNTPIRGPDGTVNSVLSMVQDITDRRRAEETLKESEERYRLLAENVTDVIWAREMNLQLTYISPSVTRLRGYSVEEAMAQKLEEVLTPASLEVAMKFLAEELETEKMAVKDLTRLRTIELEEKCKDGSTIWTESVVTFLRDPGGRPIGILGVTRDIYERKRSEELLRKSEKKYRDLVDNALIGIYKTNLQGDILFTNETLAKMLEFESPRELMSVSIQSTYKNLKDREVFIEKLKKEGKIDSFEREMVTKSGKTINVLLSVTLEGDILSGMVRDITEHKRAEEEREKLRAQLIQAQKMESIGTLAGGVAHDFNNMLNTIQGYAQLSMMSLKESDPLYKNLEKIEQASMRAAGLTRQLLLFSRRQAMELRSCHLNEILSNLIKMLKRLIGEDIEVHLELGSDLWKVKGDPGNIEQVIMNLMVNARDAMLEGGKITIKTENVEIDKDYCETYTYARPGQFVRLSIEDEGMGMDKEVMQHIFEPFFTTKEVGKGTGLGLSVVYGIVNQHEGWINVYSEPGRGSVFKVYPPASFVALPEKGKVEVVSKQDFQGKGEKILLVEDDEAIRQFAQRVLAERGYEVFAAAHAEEANRIFVEEKGYFHLVFSDVILPGKSGLPMIEQFLSIRPDLEVLLTSGYTDQKSQWPIIQEKGYRFIQKPYGLTDLLRVLREVLDQKAQ